MFGPKFLNLHMIRLISSLVKSLKILHHMYFNCCLLLKKTVLNTYRTDNHNKKRKTFHHEDINANYKNYFVTVIQPYGKIFLQVHRRHRASMESVLLFRSFEKDFTKKRIFQNNWFHEKRFFRIIGFTKKNESEQQQHCCLNIH